jgi:hypothetical protein
MPARDRTGPWGYGPRTGWGMGPCGRGLRRGAGWGAWPGWGYGPAYQPTKEQEIADLRAEKESVERELEDIRTRLKELESKK